MKRTFLLACAMAIAISSAAQVFDQYFTDATLRIDYALNGDASGQSIALNRLYELSGWAGRRHHLAELPLLGNGRTTVTERATGEVIYQTSFSSLFIEWLETEEAQTTTRSFQHTVLVPMPASPVDVETVLTNPLNEVVARIRHTVDPTDILIGKKSTDKVTPHRYIVESGSAADCIDVAILAEGYTADEMETFYQDAAIAAESLFRHEPFGSLKDRFNIVAVASESEDSGVSVPRLGVWKRTAFGSHFSTFYSDRYLTTMEVGAMHDALVGIPYEHIIVLANTNEYGGGGIYNDYTLTTAHHPMFRPVVVHEFGHSFGGLADEYFYDDDVVVATYPAEVEPWEQNITTLVDFASKWQDMLKEGTPCPTPPGERSDYPVGVYEGGGYSAHGVYRGSYDCRMRTNECPVFCPICQRAIERMIRFYTEE